MGRIQCSDTQMNPVDQDQELQDYVQAIENLLVPKATDLISYIDLLS